MKARTAQGNQIRGLLSEFGIVIPKGINADIQAGAGHTGRWRERIARHDAATASPPDRQPEGNGSTSAVNWKSKSSSGIGATKQAANWKPSPALARSRRVRSWQRLAMRANSGMAASWRRGWGWYPRQNSSGGKQTLLGISKRGDTYLRTLLIHGARSVIRLCRTARRSRRAG